MIPTNELRSGNWVQRPAPYDQRGQIIQSDSTISILHQGKKFYHYAFQLRPIALTPAIIEAIGCTIVQPDTYNLVLESHHFLLKLQPDLKVAIWQSHPSKSLQLGEVKHLHQLQNLLYKLTDQELKIDRAALEAEDLNQKVSMITA